MNTAQVVETSVTVNIQDYIYPDNHTQPTYESFNDSWVQTFHKIRAISRQQTYTLQCGGLLNMYSFISMITISDLVNMCKIENNSYF